MIRLYTSEQLCAEKILIPTEKQGHYLQHVMRLRENEIVSLFNGQDGEWTAAVRFPEKKKIELHIKEQIRQQCTETDCILCFALIKKENTDLILQKATELGVTEIYPMITERTVVRQFNLERAQTIVAEAAEQCERLTVPVVHHPQSLQETIKQLQGNCTPVYLAERADVSDNLSQIKIPAFFIGPEGGFSSSENRFLSEQKNVKTVHLGNTILRAETAAIAILSCWQFRIF